MVFEFWLDEVASQGIELEQQVEGSELWRIVMF